MKIVIIGGVAGGMSAAARLRRLDEKSDIVVIEKSGYVSFANCGLPYYIGGVIEEKENLLLETPYTLKEKFNLDVRVKSEVVSINREKKEIDNREKPFSTTADLAEFIELQKTFADSPKSWRVDATTLDNASYDLSVKNPNGHEEIIHRSPQDIMDEIAALDAESAEVLAKIRALL